MSDNDWKDLKKIIAPLALPKENGFWLHQKSRVMARLSEDTPVYKNRWILVPVFGVLAAVTFWMGQSRDLERMRMAGEMEFIQNLEVVQNLELLEGLEDLDYL